jgi:hypothetical protein
MNECKRLILIATDTVPDRVTCSHPEGHPESVWHLGTLIDGRRYEWTVPRGACVRGRFV